MLSGEPATVTSKRYPLLFAGGETANGVPIINGQHPHDLFMELAASYKVRLGEKTSVQLYGGPRGEPALGPAGVSASRLRLGESGGRDLASPSGLDAHRDQRRDARAPRADR